MPYRRMSRFRTPVRRTRRKYQWVRESISSGSPNGLKNSFDLMGTFKQRMGITLNLPDIVIWRILLKVSVRFDLQPQVFTASDGVLVSVFTDSLPLDPAFNAETEPYAEQYLMWDTLYVSETLIQGNPVSSTSTSNVLYRSYDIKSHRKLANIDDTPILQLVSTGNLLQLEESYTLSMLLKLP